MDETGHPLTLIFIIYFSLTKNLIKNQSEQKILKKLWNVKRKDCSGKLGDSDAPCADGRRNAFGSFEKYKIKCK